MRFVFTPNGWEDYIFWQSSDRATLTRINRQLDDIARDPFDGIGKPEQLRHALTRSRAHGGAESMKSTASCTSSRAKTS